MESVKKVSGQSIPHAALGASCSDTPHSSERWTWVFFKDLGVTFKVRPDVQSRVSMTSRELNLSPQTAVSYTSMKQDSG